MKKEVWLTRSPEWIKDNPGKGTLYKAIVDITKGVVPKNTVKELRDRIKKDTSPAIAGVYVIKCEVLKSVYIGQSINIPSRLRQHKLMLKRQNRNTKIQAYKQMYKDIDVHGLEAFEFVKYKVLNTPDINTLLHEENEVMQFFLLQGYRLYNTAVNLNQNYIYCPIQYQQQVKNFILNLMNS